MAPPFRRYHERKADQAWVMAGWARKDGDALDEERWMKEAQKHDALSRMCADPTCRCQKSRP